MDTRIHVRGTVVDSPITDDEALEPRASFQLANEQLGPYRNGFRPTRTVTWCEVLCSGDLARNVTNSLRRGDFVNVWGELRVITSQYEDDDRVILAINAETIGHDLARGISWFSTHDGWPDFHHGLN